MSNVIPIKPKHLPQFVGYAEVEAALGVSRRTVERMVREGKFPMPVQLTPNRVGWKVDTVTAWLDERSKGLAARAVASPDELQPDQVAPAIRELGARLLTEELGENVRPEQVRLLIERTATNEEIADRRAVLLQELEELCGHFPLERAIYIMASLFSAYREHLNAPANSEMFSTPERLREFAIDVLDDDFWAEYEDAIATALAKLGNAANRSGGNNH